MALTLWSNGHARKTITRMELGEILKHYRERLGDTLEEVAFRAGTDASNLSRIERGLQQPSVTVLMNIAEALNVRVSAVFTQLESQFEVAENETTWDQSTVQMLRILKGLTPTQRELVLRITRVVAEQGKGR